MHHIHVSEKEKHLPKKRYGFLTWVSIGTNLPTKTGGHFRQHPQVELEPLPWRVAFQHLSRGSWRFWKKNGGFSPTNPWGFPTKHVDILGCEMGVTHHFFRKHPTTWTSNPTGFENKKTHGLFFLRDGYAAGDAPRDQPLYNQRRYNEGNCSYPLTQPSFIEIVDLRVPIWVQYVWHGLKLFSTHQNFRGGPNHHGPTASSKRIECYKILRQQCHHTESTTHTQHSWSSYVIKCKLNRRTTSVQNWIGKKDLVVFTWNSMKHRTSLVLQAGLCLLKSTTVSWKKWSSNGCVWNPRKNTLKGLWNIPNRRIAKFNDGSVMVGVFGFYMRSFP